MICIWLFDIFKSNSKLPSFFFFFEFEIFVNNIFDIGFTQIENKFNKGLKGFSFIAQQRKLSSALKDVCQDDWLRFCSGLWGLTKDHRPRDSQLRVVKIFFIHFNFQKYCFV